MVREGGQPRKFARWEMDRAIASAANLERRLELLKPRELPAASGRNFLTREPYGVVGVLPPRNTPLVVPLYTMLCALGAGNAVVEKPSSLGSSHLPAARPDRRRGGLPGRQRPVLHLPRGRRRVGVHREPRGRRPRPLRLQPRRQGQPDQDGLLPRKNEEDARRMHAPRGRPDEEVRPRARGERPVHRARERGPDEGRRRRPPRRFRAQRAALHRRQAVPRPALGRVGVPGAPRRGNRPAEGGRPAPGGDGHRPHREAREPGHRDVPGPGGPGARRPSSHRGPGRRPRSSTRR